MQFKQSPYSNGFSNRKEDHLRRPVLPPPRLCYCKQSPPPHFLFVPRSVSQARKESGKCTNYLHKTCKSNSNKVILASLICLLVLIRHNGHEKQIMDSKQDKRGRKSRVHKTWVHKLLKMDGHNGIWNRWKESLQWWPRGQNGWAQCFPANQTEHDFDPVVPCSWRHWSEHQLTCKSLAIYKNLQALCVVSVVFKLEEGRRVAAQELLYSTEEKPPTDGVLIHTFHPQVLEVAKWKSKSRQVRIRLIKVIFQIIPTIF